MSHDTWRLVRDMVHAPSLGPLSIKGLKAPLEVHDLQGAGAARHAATARNQSPFIGRRQEISSLQQNWQSASRGRGQAVVYSGEAGVGKSRLYQEFLNSLPGAEGRVLRGSFNIHGKPSPFQALVSLLFDYFSIEARDSHDQLRERLDAGLTTFANAATNLRTPFLALFQVAIDDDEAWRLADPMQRRRRTLNALIEFVSLLAVRLSIGTSIRRPAARLQGQPGLVRGTDRGPGRSADPAFGEPSQRIYARLAQSEALPAARTAVP